MCGSCKTHVQAKFVLWATCVQHLHSITMLTVIRENQDNLGDLVWKEKAEEQIHGGGEAI